MLPLIYEVSSLDDHILWWMETNETNETNEPIQWDLLLKIILLMWYSRRLTHKMVEKLSWKIHIQTNDDI